MIPNRSLPKLHHFSGATQSLAPSTRLFSTSPVYRNARSASQPPKQKPHEIDPRWLTSTKKRIGKCMMFGLKPHQVHEAGKILQIIAKDWRELIAGSEGYLTEETRRGLFRQSVAWGEMDSMDVKLIRETGYVMPFRNIEHLHPQLLNSMFKTYTSAQGMSTTSPIHVDPAHKREWKDLVSSKGFGIILRSIKIDYKFPMKYPDKVTVYHKLAHDPLSPHSSQYAFHLQAVILSEAHQRPAARVDEDLVTYDYKLGKKAALPPFMMEQFKATWALQEQAKRLWRERILELENRVRALEVDSWDRPDAVEDTGSAKK